jgi:hypothetical protein
MRTPKDVTELRDELLIAFGMVKDDPRRANQVKEMVNAAGKVIGTVKVQLEYCLLRNEQPDIPFMGKTSGKQLNAGTRPALTA